MVKRLWIGFALLSIMLGFGQSSDAAQFSITTERINTAPDGNAANSFSLGVALSADGKVAAFSSWASNLVEGDTNNMGDIIVRDLATGEMTIASVASNGTQSNRNSFNADLSGDGRFVVFRSESGFLSPDDTNDSDDIFVHDRQTRQTDRIVAEFQGTKLDFGCVAPSISDDGRFVAFVCKVSEESYNHIFLYDRDTGETQLISATPDGKLANEASNGPIVSADGQHIVFASGATNLVSDDTNAVSDIFVYRRMTDDLIRLPHSLEGSQANNHSGSPDITSDGHLLVFSSLATNLTEPFSSTSHIYLGDQTDVATSRLSVSSDGTPGDFASGSPKISADGRYVIFESMATNLIPVNHSGQSSAIYRHDRQTGQTIRVSSGVDGEYPNADVLFASLSADGRMVAFDSDASNLVENDTNGEGDIFVVRLP